MDFQTADLCDAHEADVRVVSPIFRSFGGRKAFSGRISTVKVFEDNGLVRSALERQAEGRVLVVDGGGSLRRALLGDQLAALALSNGWNGILLYGCIRDARAIAGMQLGVIALATHPLKTVKKNEGQADLAVTFGGVTFFPGHWLYADEDGILVSQDPLV